MASEIAKDKMPDGENSFHEHSVDGGVGVEKGIPNPDAEERVVVTDEDVSRRLRWTLMLGALTVVFRARGFLRTVASNLSQDRHPRPDDSLLDLLPSDPVSIAASNVATGFAGTRSTSLDRAATSL